MPRIDINSEIMYSSTGSEDSLDEVSCSKPALILYDSHTFGATYRMFNPYSERRYFPVVRFFFLSKLSTFGLFYRLENSNTFRIVSLIPRILIQQAGIGERIHCIGYLFVMHFPADTRADIKNQTASRNNNSILDGMLLLFPAVIFLLLLRINRAGNFPFRSIVKQNRKSIFTRLVFEQLLKLLLCFCRHYFCIPQTLFKNTVQNMNKVVTMFLIHIETGCMIFLKRIIFQINQNKEQPIFDRGKRAVAVYGKTSPVIAILPAHIVMGEILVMCFFKIGKQLDELFAGKTRQRTETFFVIFIICIFHSAKVRTRTHYTKSNLHKL